MSKDEGSPKLEVRIASLAAQGALDDSGAAKDQLDPTRFGVEFGAGLIASELEDPSIIPNIAIHLTGRLKRTAISNSKNSPSWNVIQLYGAAIQLERKREAGRLGT